MHLVWSKLWVQLNNLSRCASVSPTAEKVKHIQLSWCPCHSRLGYHKRSLAAHEIGAWQQVKIIGNSHQTAIILMIMTLHGYQLINLHTPPPFKFKTRGKFKIISSSVITQNRSRSKVPIVSKAFINATYQFLSANYKLVFQIRCNLHKLSYFITHWSYQFAHLEFCINQTSKN